jgi:hypothetical protein
MLEYNILWQVELAQDRHSIVSFTAALVRNSILLVYTWYMGKRAPIYRAGKARECVQSSTSRRTFP